jgi:hypothetical protein
MAETNSTSNSPEPPRSYANDYAGWIEDGRFHEIDRAALPDEVRDLGKSERRELKAP